MKVIMKSSRIGLATMAALLAAGMSVVDTGERMVRAAQPRRRTRIDDGPRRRYRIAASGTSQYPEQGERQALRGMRRAQGGPGLVMTRDGWAPRTEGAQA